MTEPRPKRRIKLWLLAAAAAVVVLLPLGVLGLLWSGWADDFVRRAVIEQVANITGGRVDLEQMEFDPWGLRVTVRNLTVHGREPDGTPPFFHTDGLEIALSVDSFWGRRVSLRSLELTRPAIHLRFERDGSNNAPLPRPRTQEIERTAPFLDYADLMRSLLKEAPA